MVLGYELVESRGGLAGQGDKQHRQPVRSEFAGYLDCSVLQRGFAHLACEGTVRPREVVRALVETIGVATGDLARADFQSAPELMPLAPDADLPGKLKIPVLLKKDKLAVEKTHKLKLKAIRAAMAVSILELDRWFIPQHETCNVRYGLEGDVECGDKVLLDVFGSNYCECTDWNKGNGTFGAPVDLVDVPLLTRDLAKQAEERRDYGLPEDAPWRGEVTATTGMLGRKTAAAANRYVNVAFSPYTVHVRYFKAGADKNARIVLDPFWPRWKETPTAQTVAVDVATKKVSWTNAADADRGALCIEDKTGQSVCLIELTGELLKSGARELTWNAAYRPGAMNSHFGAVMLADDKPYQATVTTWKSEVETTPMKVGWEVKKSSNLARGIVQITDGGGKLFFHKPLKKVLCAEGKHQLDWDGKYGPGVKNSQYQVFRTESDGTPATTGLIGTAAGTTIDDNGLVAGVAALAPPGSWSAVQNSERAIDRAWDRHCVMSYAGCGGDFPPSNREYLCGKCLLRHRGWRVQGLGHPGPKVREP